MTQDNWYPWPGPESPSQNEYCIVTRELPDGTRVTSAEFFEHGEFMHNFTPYNLVVAWTHMPEPFNAGQQCVTSDV